MITLKNISKKFQRKGEVVTALSDVTLHVPEGRIFGVIGASGAGKSTLIRCINLLEKPDQGSVLIDGKDLTSLSAKALSRERRHIGMIFQHFNLLASRTVLENISFPLELDGKRSRQQIKERAYELLHLVGLEDKAHDYPAKLSGGQKQRVAIARALAAEPKVLLCDEATSALDPVTTQSILDLLKDINRRLNLTILLITHEMEVVRALCDEVAVINKGEIVEQGRVADVFARPQTAIARSFIVSSFKAALPDVYSRRLKTLSEGELNPVLKLEFKGADTDETALSEIARRFYVDAHLISAQVDYAGDVRFGVLLVELSGRRENFEAAIHFFEHKQFHTTIIGYV
jgi:D-methionine transport system ATP-binding protein